MAFSKDDVRQARQTELLSYLESQNDLALKEGKTPPYKIVKDGQQYRLKDHGGLLFQRNMWNQRNTGKGGNTLEFLVEIEGRPFKEAVELLTGKIQSKPLNRVDPAKIYEKPKEPFQLPERNETFRRAIAYLTKTRGLDAKIVLEEIKKGHIYEDKDHHNVVFVGKDKNDQPVWAQKRSTLSERKLVLDQPGSDPGYSYGYGNPNARTVVVVEAPIEALSLANLLIMKNKDISNLYIKSLGGVHDTALQQHLLDHPECKGIITALNNDFGKKPNEIKGREASKLIKESFERKGYSVASIFPTAEDWNDDLRAIRLEDKEKNVELNKEKDVEAQIKEYAKMKKEKAREQARTLSRTR